MIYAQVADHLAERAPRGPRSVGAALFAAGGFDELARQFDLTSDDVEDAVRSRLGPRDAASPPVTTWLLHVLYLESSDAWQSTTHVEVSAHANSCPEHAL